MPKKGGKKGGKKKKTFVEDQYVEPFGFKVGLLSQGVSVVTSRLP